MKTSQLGQDRVKNIAKILMGMIQLMPIHFGNNDSRRHFLKALVHDQELAKVVSFESIERVNGLMSYELENQTLRLTNLLLPKNKNNSKYGISFWLKQVEKQGKEQGCQKIEINLVFMNEHIKKVLIRNGYHGDLLEKHNWRFTKSLSYRTALVLAGGGARGAYQIGAWRGLRELEISYDLICGTSVGSLNGGLILQGDYESAEKMWREIETNKILAFSMTESPSNYTPSGMLKTIQEFMKSAITEQGVSTAPLKALIQALIDEEKLRNCNKDFFLCTTELPQLKEKVVSLAETEPGQIQDWLLASSSFFPAMAATEIAGNYYVDGGYRNNIPIDVALKQGATEIIVIDVKGPGITKPVSVPPEIPLKWISSPWSLGTVLLFDGARSHWNIELGYLETLKAFGKYWGYWYTFEKENQKTALETWDRQLKKLVYREIEKTKVSHKQVLDYFKDNIKKMRKLYNDDINEETFSVFVLEYLGKAFNVSPIKLYTIESMKAEIKKSMLRHQNEDGPGNKMLLTLQEWVKLYVDDLSLPTEKQQILYLYHKIKGEQRENIFQVMSQLAPLEYLAAIVLNDLMNEKEKS